jgi:hypothetical protein
VINSPFTNEGDVSIKIDISIKVSASGTFEGVMQGDKLISADDWNEQFEPIVDEKK